MPLLKEAAWAVVMAGGIGGVVICVAGFAGGVMAKLSG